MTKFTVTYQRKDGLVKTIKVMGKSQQHAINTVKRFLLEDHILFAKEVL